MGIVLHSALRAHRCTGVKKLRGRLGGVGTVVGMRIRTLHAAALGAVVLVLAGCVDSDPLPTLPPTPTSTPVFASEEEALAAAEEAYAAYNDTSNVIAAEGGIGPERIEPFVTPAYLPTELDTYAYYRSNSLRLSGEVVVSRVELQQYVELENAVEVSVYVCLDVAGTQVLDEAGSDVTPAGRQPVVGLEVVLVGDAAGTLKIDRSDQWSDSSFCS
jgi:hypothetical protein